MELGNPCTILIPRKRLRQVLSLAGARGWRPLLSRIVRAMPDRAARRVVTRALVRYQRSGQNLVRVCFRPEADDWLELGQIALHLGISRCLAFMLLVRILARGRQNIRPPFRLLVWVQSGTVVRQPLLSPESGPNVGKEITHGHVSRKARRNRLR